MEASRVRYEIAYDKTKQTVIVYPQWRGTRPNFHVIGEYTPDNPQAKVEEYVDELADEIRAALERVGELSLDPFKVMITPLNGDPEFMGKDWNGPLERVPLKDQVPVSANKTAAQAAHEEEEKGEPVPHASQATQHMDVEAVATKDDSRPPAAAKKKAASKKATSKK